jgi:type II secretory pathway pseudopilin PulG
MGSIVMKLHGDTKGVSEIFGYILILGIVMSALGIITVMATGPLQGSQNSAQFTSAEQAFSVADSRLSKALFSASTFQEVPFKLNGGTMNVNGSESDSYIEIYGPDNQLICRTAMGTVRVITDNGEIAYQDGGVWALYPDGGSIMISPPNFDYNGVTLTLPIMQLAGNGTAAYANSDVILDANSTGQPDVVYPGDKGSNLVPQGSTVNLSIRSDYYQAWAQYINERTRATAVTIPEKKLVNVSLTTGWGRQSGLVSSGYNTKGMDTSDPAPIEIFNLNLVLRNTGNDYTITFGIPSDSKKGTPDPQLLVSAQRTTGHDNKEYAQIQLKYINGSQVELFIICNSKK